MEHIVRSGETLGQIAKQMGVPISQLTGYRSGNINLIYPGERITVKGSAPVSQETPQTAAAPSLGQQIAGEQTKGVYQGPGFQEMLPIEQAWGQLSPTVEQNVQDIVNPFIQRDLNEAQRNLMNTMASQGQGRFGRGLGQVGSVQANYERQRKAMLEDMSNTYRTGFSKLFYEPTMRSWDENATALGRAPEMPKIPTFNELQGKMRFENTLPKTNLTSTSV